MNVMVVGLLASFMPVTRTLSRVVPARAFSTMSVVEEINSAIAKNDVVVFSKSYCPYCTKTKTLFKEIGMNAKVFELDLMSDGDVYQSELLTMTNQRTVPNVFVKGKHVGGNDDTQKMFSKMRLAK